MSKPLESRTGDTLPSTSSLPQEEVKAVYEITRVMSSLKTWTIDQLIKVRAFLQDTIEIYEDSHLLENALILCRKQWKSQLDGFVKAIKLLKRIKGLGENVIKGEDILKGEDISNLKRCVDILEMVDTID